MSTGAPIDAAGLAAHWQTLAAAAIAVVCAAWVLWRLARPFLSRFAGACGGACGGSASCIEDRDRADAEELIQITPADPERR